jgi:hypothetical protein
VGQVRKLVKVEYGVSYGKRQMQRILRQLGLYCYKPQPRDYRQPGKADEKLKERLRAVADALGLKGQDLEQLCIGFADESSPQLHCNSVRLWSTRKGVLKKVNTDKKRCNSFGFYRGRHNLSEKGIGLFTKTGSVQGTVSGEIGVQLSLLGIGGFFQAAGHEGLTCKWSLRRSPKIIESWDSVKLQLAAGIVHFFAMFCVVLQKR